MESQRRKLDEIFQRNYFGQFLLGGVWLRRRWSGAGSGMGQCLEGEELPKCLTGKDPEAQQRRRVLTFLDKYVRK